MGEGANFRNAIAGSFPAVTACAHATIGTGAFPRPRHHGPQHPRRRRVAQGLRQPGQAEPLDILLPTLAELWTERPATAHGRRVRLPDLAPGHDRQRRATDRGDQKPVGVYWDEPEYGDDLAIGAAEPRPVPHARSCPGSTDETHRAAFDDARSRTGVHADGPSAVLHAARSRVPGRPDRGTFDSEPSGKRRTDLLYINYKSPDYAGHIYNMLSQWEGRCCRGRRQLGAGRELEARLPGRVRADRHRGPRAVPAARAVDGVRLDPIQLAGIEQRFGGRSAPPCRAWSPPRSTWTPGVPCVTRPLRTRTSRRSAQLPYRQNIGPYVPKNAIEQDLLESRSSRRCSPRGTSTGSRTPTCRVFGETTYPDGDPDRDPGDPV